MQHYVCAALLAVNSFSRIGAQAFAFPADAFVLSSLCRARVNRYFIGDNKGRIKADAKAPDQLRVLGGVAGERLKEFIGTDGAQVFLRLFHRHADAVIGNRQRSRILIGLHADSEDRIVAQKLLVGKRQKVQLIQGVRGVGNEFPQKDFFIGVKRVGEKIK